MNLLNEFWHFEGVINSETCDKLLDLKKENEFTKGVVADKKTENSEDFEKIDSKTKIRKSNIFWVNEQWVYDLVTPLVAAANENAKWNFQIDAAEPAQFTEYTKDGHYDWHRDAYKQPFKNHVDVANGKIRKLSVTISLTDSKDYTGGDLEFAHLEPDETKKKIFHKDGFRKRGSVIVFPSFVWHRVTPVLSGVRDSIVIWYLGNPFV